jgi:hypothetical protein
MGLSQGVNMMTSPRLLLSLISFVVLFAAAPRFTLADDPALSELVGTESNVGQLTFTGTVLMSDGSPAAGAIVEASDGSWEATSKVTRADESGRVQIRDVFGAGAKIHARTADGEFQATLRTPAAATRAAFSVPVELRLAPAVIHEVTVLSQGSPVDGAHVAASGYGFRVQEVTDADGKVQLRFPADQKVRSLVAWHSKQGVAGVWGGEQGIRPQSTALSLRAPAPYTVRLIDNRGEPVAGLKLGISVKTEDGDWIQARDIDATQTSTNNSGEAVLEWLPADRLTYMSVNIVGADWKIDATDQDQTADRITTVHVRREWPAEGRILMPEGASAEGLLVTGYGFGPQGGHGLYARVQRDGTFTFDVASAHGYIIGVSDREWASDYWTGMILGNDSDRPNAVRLEAYSATPLTVRVTRGPNHAPVADASAHLMRFGRVGFVEASGRERTGNSGVSDSLLTDANGGAQTGVGRGEIEVRLSAGGWSETRMIEVSSGEPVVVEFHRAWEGPRHVTARPTLDGAPYKPSPELICRAWTERSRRSRETDRIHEVRFRDDGLVEVSFDEEHLSLLVIDRERQLSGFAHFGPSDTSMELIMQQTASYSGTLIDENGEPLADRELGLVTRSAFLDVVEPQRTDAAGRFQFTSVPVNVPLSLRINTVVPGQIGDRLFEPREVRENDMVHAPRIGLTANATPPSPPLSRMVADICRNARLGGMRALALLQGDESENVGSATARVCDWEDVPPVLGYLPITLSAAQMKSEADVLAAFRWPLPMEGEITLVVLDGDSQMIAAQRSSTSDVNAAVVLGNEFLQRHRPPPRNALAMLAKARQEAKQDNRRLWIIRSGPRCGPCFRLARWIEDHDAVLAKDYVIVKVMEGLDEHADDALADLGGAESGIPWFAITEPDGVVLATSDGPLRNIGMPSSVEDVRHFRRMLEGTARRLTSEEIDTLITTLAGAE